MLKKVLIGGAVAASIFGIAGASASQLTDSSTNGYVVQQSNQLNATCSATNGQAGQAGSGEFQTYVHDGSLLAVRMYQQDFSGCAGVEAQAAVTLNTGGNQVVYSDIDTFTNDGLDVYLDFPSAINPAQVQSVQVTLAGDISNFNEPGVVYTNQYGGSPNHTAPQ